MTKEWVARTSLQRGPTVLVFCDSYTNGMMSKFLDESFPVSAFKHHNLMIMDVDALRANHPDVVLYIVAERLLPFVLDPTLP